MKIFHKIGLLIVSTFLVSSFVSIYVSFRLARNEIREEFLRRLEALGLSLQLSSREAMRNYEDFLIQDFVNDIQSEPDVAYAYIVSKSGIIVAHSDPKKINTPLPHPASPRFPEIVTLNGGDIDQISIPLGEGGFSEVVVGLSTARMRKAVWLLAMKFIVLGILLLAIFLSVTAVFLRSLLAPMGELYEGIRLVGEGNFNYQVPVETKDELGELSLAFNAMVWHIKNLAQDLERRNAQLELSNKELDAFSYSVSHDLRSPLLAISGFSSVLLEDYGDKLDEEGRDCLNRIVKAGEHMGELIDALLKLSHMNTSEIHRTVVDLSALTLQILEDLGKMHPERKVTFRVQGGVEASADPRLIRIALENLLGNAWKYSARNPEAVIEFGVNWEDGKREYFVRDNGVGFDASRSEKIFQPFQRFHASSEFPGSGIGLATVQRIVRRHGGDIYVKSSSGKGATFYFTLGEENQ